MRRTQPAEFPVEDFHAHYRINWFIRAYVSSSIHVNLKLHKLSKINSKKIIESES
jgi:hypothetical protein